MSAFYVIAAAALAAGIWLGATYNAFVRRRNMCAEAWSGIDVQLVRRQNLIPALVDSVKGYMTHEKDVLAEVTAQRARSVDASGPAEQARAEGLLSTALAGLLAVAENYPQLKADGTFLDLQDELATLEKDIHLARRYYNGAARRLNVLAESFPSNLVARWFDISGAEYFEPDDPGTRQMPKVDFHSRGADKA